MQFERPITKKMKAAAEAERKARLEAEYRAAIERQRAEQQARVEKARIEWENLLRNLPGELKRIEEIVTKELIPEWQEKINAEIDWDEVGEPICSTKWELHFNKYERVEDYISYYYESSDTRRAGVDKERVVREKMPGFYWTNPLDRSGKEWFISRASSPDGPVPEIQYPYCTIAGELSLWKEYPHDKARVDAIIHKLMEDRVYYRNLIEEANKALAGSAQERAKYLLNRREGDKVKNELKRVWRTLNPDKSETKFWDNILESVR
jgi:hypothetical protein